MALHNRDLVLFHLYFLGGDYTYYVFYIRAYMFGHHHHSHLPLDYCYIQQSVSHLYMQLNQG